MSHSRTEGSEALSVTLRGVQPWEVTKELATECGKLIPFLYDGDDGRPIAMDRLGKNSRQPSVLLIATLGDIAFGNAAAGDETITDVPSQTIPFPGSANMYKSLLENHRVVGQAILHQIGGFRDGRDWLEDLVVHPEARGGSPTIGRVFYNTLATMSRRRQSRSMFYTAAPKRESAHRLYLDSGATILAGDPYSKTNLFAHNHTERD